MSHLAQIRAYLETYYPQLIEKADENGDYYFEHTCTFKDYPSLVAATIDKTIQTVTLQVMIGKYFDAVDLEKDVYEYINELNMDYKFASFSKVQNALNIEYNLLIRPDIFPPIMEHILLLTTAANDITGPEVHFEFEMD